MEEKKNYPFLLSPIGKNYLWGGSKLMSEYNKNIDLDIIAETWECSTNPDGYSSVASGSFKCQTLKNVLKQNPEFLGTNNINEKGEIPILIKLIDARQNLSIQVHPTDEYAFKNENGQNGKNEMWYILEAEDDAKLIKGFKGEVNRNLVKEAVENKEIEQYLNKVKVKSGDAFYIKAGTVHSIGAGIVIAEIQQNSNLTYRLYDYDRTDKNGKKRELHLQKALDVIDYKNENEDFKCGEAVKYSEGYISKKVCECENFKVYKENINSKNIAFNTNKESFQVFLCINGSGKLDFDGQFIDIKKGDCVFVPADSVKITISGDFEFLRVSC